MKLKFIGADGSMGLRHGEVYDVEIKTGGEFIRVLIPGFRFAENHLGTWSCPYSSPTTLAANWEKAWEG